MDFGPIHPPSPTRPLPPPRPLAVPAGNRELELRAIRERFTFCARRDVARHRAFSVHHRRAMCKASREGGGRDQAEYCSGLAHNGRGSEGLFMLNEWNMLNGDIPAAVRKKGNYKFPSS